MRDAFYELQAHKIFLARERDDRAALRQYFLFHADWMEIQSDMPEFEWHAQLALLARKD